MSEEAGTKTAENSANTPSAPDIKYIEGGILKPGDKLGENEWLLSVDGRTRFGIRDGKAVLEDVNSGGVLQTLSDADERGTSIVYNESKLELRNKDGDEIWTADSYTGDSRKPGDLGYEPSWESYDADDEYGPKNFVLTNDRFLSAVFKDVRTDGKWNGYLDYADNSRILETWGDPKELDKKADDLAKKKFFGPDRGVLEEGKKVSEFPLQIGLPPGTPSNELVDTIKWANYQLRLIMDEMGAVDATDIDDPQFKAHLDKLKGDSELFDTLSKGGEGKSEDAYWKARVQIDSLERSSVETDRELGAVEYEISALNHDFYSKMYNKVQDTNREIWQVLEKGVTRYFGSTLETQYTKVGVQSVVEEGPIYKMIESALDFCTGTVWDYAKAAADISDDLDHKIAEVKSFLDRQDEKAKESGDGKEKEGDGKETEDTPAVKAVKDQLAAANKEIDSQKGVIAGLQRQIDGLKNGTGGNNGGSPGNNGGSPGNNVGNPGNNGGGTGNGEGNGNDGGGKVTPEDPTPKDALKEVEAAFDDILGPDDASGSAEGGDEQGSGTDEDAPVEGDTAGLGQVLGGLGLTGTQQGAAGAATQSAAGGLGGLAQMATSALPMVGMGLAAVAPQLIEAFTEGQDGDSDKGEKERSEPADKGAGDGGQANGGQPGAAQAPGAEGSTPIVSATYDAGPPQPVDTGGMVDHPLPNGDGTVKVEQEVAQGLREQAANPAKDAAAAYAGTEAADTSKWMPLDNRWDGQTGDVVKWSNFSSILVRRGNNRYLQQGDQLIAFDPENPVPPGPDYGTFEGMFRPAGVNDGVTVETAAPMA